MPPPPPPMAALFLLFAALAAGAAAAASSGPHIADVNVLLPPRMTNPVEFRLLGSDGCFVWSWDHHDILSVQPEFNGSTRCSTSARLISTAPYSSRKETAVYARDLRSGTTVRCKVIIDTLKRIQIFHHANKIDLDDLASLRIRAFDDEENEFSSLVGLQFSWKLVSKSIEPDNVHHLVHVPLKETPLSDCGGFCGDLVTQIQLEDRGVASDLYVVKGVGIGHELVSAQLLEPHLEHLSDRIVLTVAEAMSLFPRSPVFVTVGALIYYRLFSIRQNNPQVIDLPSQHHRWSVMNSSVAKVDSMMGIAHALNLGQTNIMVEDTRLSGHAQLSSIHVVVPNKLCLYLVPLSLEYSPLDGTEPIPPSITWYVFPGQNYAILMKVYSESSGVDELHITENNDLKLEADTLNYWDIVSLPEDIATTYDWPNSRLFKPISTGHGSLSASLTYRRGILEIAEVLKVQQQVVVCSKVKFAVMEEDDHDTQIIRLPWAHGVYQEVELKATGGCGKTAKDYSWSSSDITTVSVSSYGVAQARRPGQAIVKVVSNFDPINYDEVIVEVVIPSSMVMLPSFPVEAVVGERLQAAVALKTSSGDYFHRCDSFSSFIRWMVLSESESFEVLNTTGEVLGSYIGLIEGFKIQHGSYCAWTCLYASHAGRAVLHATLSSELLSYGSSTGSTVLEATSILAAYFPLVFRQAGNGNQFGGYWVDTDQLRAGIQESGYTGLDELYLVPGSEIDVMLLGGPEKWSEGVQYIQNVGVLGEQDVPVTEGVLVQSSSTDERVYKVLCQTLGKFKLLFSRGNLACDDHPKPYIAKAELSIICDFPSSITLIANEPENTLDVIEAATKADRGLERIRSSPLIVANGRAIRLAAVGIHESQRPFANSSSFCLMWQLIGCEMLAEWNDLDSIYKSEGTTTWERFLFLQNASGLCTVRAKVIGISKTMASDLHEKAYDLLESAEYNLTDAIPLRLISSLQIIPEFIVLVLSPKAKANLSITGGTCFLDVRLNDTLVAEVSQPPQSARCSHLFLDAKGLGVALVTVRDVGLSPPATATALVKVANVDWIKIISPEEISLMEGTIKSFDLVAGTLDGYIFDSSQYAYMDIHVHLEDTILELTNMNDSSTSDGWLVFGPSISVKGAALGITTLYVSVRQRAGHEVFSQFVKVEVYKPLQVHPGYIYLGPGASYGLKVKGGPTLGAYVEYSSVHSETAIVHRSSGRISAVSVGNTTVWASAYGTGGILICEAQCKVEVAIPSTMVLNLQSDRLCIGCKMPIFPSFPKGNLFSFYEICNDYMWSIEDEEVLSFPSAIPLHSDMHGVQLPCTAGKTDGCYSHDTHYGFVNVLFGRSAGRTKVSVSLSCDFASSGTSKQVSYAISELVTVVSDPPLALGLPITWILPPFYTTSDLLLGSSDSYGSLDKKRTRYSVLEARGRNELSKEEAITVVGRKIRTKETNNLACIQVKDQTTGRTEIASCIRVAEVAQIRLTTLESSFHVAYLAMHAKLEVFVSYCDDLGYPFTEADGVMPLEIETNYPDILSILMPMTDDGTHSSNGKVFIQAHSQGKALLRISMKHNPQKTDYILVSVGAQLHPRNPVLHVGHFQNFSVVGAGMDGVGSGKWVSSNKSVLSVTANSGEVYACGEGVAEVIFEGSNFKLQTTVTVLKADRIVVDAPAETLTNAPFQPQGYKFAVRFSDPLGSGLKASGNIIRVPYDCSVDPPHIGYAKSWIDHGTGDSYCLFFPHSPNHLASFLSKSKAITQEEISRSEGFLHVSIIASLREAPHLMGSTRAPFIAGFAMEETGKIKLKPNSNKSEITLTGNTDVAIYWNVKDLLSISLRSKDGSGLANHAVYEIKALKCQNFTDKIIIVLPANGQTAEIDVSYEAEENIPPSGTRGVTWTAVFICAVGLVMTVVIFMRLLDRPDRSEPSRPEVATTPSVAGPATPARSPAAAAAAAAQSSPRTPQPFIDYVRRTVDETPYYKRTGRRFDPQRTY